MSITVQDAVRAVGRLKKQGNAFIPTPTEKGTKIWHWVTTSGKQIQLESLWPERKVAAGDEFPGGSLANLNEKRKEFWSRNVVGRCKPWGWIIEWSVEGELNLLCFAPLFQDLEILCQSPTANPSPLVLENDFGIEILRLPFGYVDLSPQVRRETCLLRDVWGAREPRGSRFCTEPESKRGKAYACNQGP